MIITRIDWFYFGICGSSINTKIYKSPTQKSQPVDWEGYFWSFFTFKQIPTCHLTGWDYFYTLFPFMHSYNQEINPYNQIHIIYDDDDGRTTDDDDGRTTV